MASGYYLYSLDTSKFQSFVDKPTQKQLMFLSNEFREYIDIGLSHFHEPPKCHDWPKEIADFAVEVATRLQKPDWYSDLFEVEKNAWEHAFTHACESNKHVDVGFKIAGKDSLSLEFMYHLRGEFGITEHSLYRSKKEIVKFGTLPYRARPSAIHRPIPIFQKGPFYWYPNHSMHSPEAVVQILEELRTVQSRFLKKAEARHQEEYTGVLIKALEKIIKSKCMLYVQVST